MQVKAEAKLMDLFPPLAHETIADPCVIADTNGCALTWYLPGVISPERQVSGCFYVANNLLSLHK